MTGTGPGRELRVDRCAPARGGRVEGGYFRIGGRTCWQGEMGRLGKGWPQPMGKTQVEPHPEYRRAGHRATVGHDMKTGITEGEGGCTAPTGRSGREGCGTECN